MPKSLTSSSSNTVPGGWRHSSPSRSLGRRWGPACPERTIGGCRRVCRIHGVLLIVDEVMTGFGRTGAWFASEHWGVAARIDGVAKGAASGYWPLGLPSPAAGVHDDHDRWLHARASPFPPRRGGAAGRAVLAVLRNSISFGASRDRGNNSTPRAARRTREPPSGRRHPWSGAAASGGAGFGPTDSGRVRPLGPSIERVVAAGKKRGVLALFLDRVRRRREGICFSARPW